MVAGNRNSTLVTMVHIRLLHRRAMIVVVRPLAMEAARLLAMEVGILATVVAPRRLLVIMELVLLATIASRRLQVIMVDTRRLRIIMEVVTRRLMVPRAGLSRMQDIMALVGRHPLLDGHRRRPITVPANSRPQGMAHRRQIIMLASHQTQDMALRQVRRHLLDGQLPLAMASHRLR